MCVLFCVFCVSIHGEVPPPLYAATDNSIFTFYFKYFLRILCTFYLSTFCLKSTFYSYSSRFIVNYFYFSVVLLEYKFKVTWAPLHDSNPGAFVAPRDAWTLSMIFSERALYESNGTYGSFCSSYIFEAAKFLAGCVRTVLYYFL
jgi:hypothetical protein